MPEDSKPRSVWLDIAAVYLLVAGAGMALGVAAESAWATPVRDHARQFDTLWALVLAGACVAVAIGMLAHANWARLLFIVLTPLAAIGLARVFSPSLWERDVPYSALLVLVHAPLAYALARRDVLHACGKPESTWLSRGGAVALGCMVLAVGLRFYVTSTKPAGGGGFFATGVALSEYAARLACAEVLLWSYVGALIAVSIPSPRPREAARMPWSPADAWVFWMLATALGSVIGRVLFGLVLTAARSVGFGVTLSEATRVSVVTAKVAAAGLLWGVCVAGLQSMVLKRWQRALPWWTLVGALGWGLTLAVSVGLLPMLFSKHLDRGGDRVVLGYVTSLPIPLTGALIVAALQWVLLRRVVPRAWRWIPGAAVAHALAVLGAGLTYAAIRPYLPEPSSGGFLAALSRDVVFGLLYGLFLGALSGLVLVWMAKTDSPNAGTS